MRHFRPFRPPLEYVMVLKVESLGSGTRYVAEQVCIERPPAFVAEMLDRPSRTWMQPCLILAWNEGCLALRRRGLAAPDRGSPTHNFRIGTPDRKDHGIAAFGLRWTVPEVSLPFGRLEGRLTVSPIPAGAGNQVAALALSGMYLGAMSPDDWAITHTPAELVVRSLLGRLRAVMAASDDADPIADGMH